MKCPILKNGNTSESRRGFQQMSEKQMGSTLSSTVSSSSSISSPIRKTSIYKAVLGCAIGFLSFVGSAQAQVWLPPGTTGLSPLQGTLKAVESRRVPVSSTVTAVETLVTLEFTLQACLDSLLPLITHYDVKGNRLTLYVTALNAHNEKSAAAICAVLPKASAQVRIPGVYGRDQIRVVFVRQLSQ